MAVPKTNRSTHLINFNRQSRSLINASPWSFSTYSGGVCLTNTAGPQGGYFQRSQQHTAFPEKYRPFDIVNTTQYDDGSTYDRFSVFKRLCALWTVFGFRMRFWHSFSSIPRPIRKLTTRDANYKQTNDCIDYQIACTLCARRCKTVIVWRSARPVHLTSRVVWRYVILPRKRFTGLVERRRDRFQARISNANCRRSKDQLRTHGMKRSEPPRKNPLFAIAKDQESRLALV